MRKKLNEHTKISLLNAILLVNKLTSERVDKFNSQEPDAKSTRCSSFTYC